MWADYKAVMALLEVSQAIAYKVIRQLQAELEEKGFLVNPNAKIPIKFFCDRYGVDLEDAKSKVAEIKKAS